MLSAMLGLFALPPNPVPYFAAPAARHYARVVPDFTPYTQCPVDPRVFRFKDTIDPTDPKFEKRRGLPSAIMDDERFFE